MFPVWMLLVAVLAFGFYFAMRRPSGAWEYKLTSPSDAFFGSTTSREGAEGWEMVAARRAVDDGVPQYEIIWKRRLR